MARAMIEQKERGKSRAEVQVQILNSSC